jgi:hypothetical protein
MEALIVIIPAISGISDPLVGHGYRATFLIKAGETLISGFVF